MEERPTLFESSGLRLYGILCEPSVAASGRGVVLIHGWSGYRIGPHRMLVHMARRLAEKGIFSLRFDLRGRGDSEGNGDTASLDDMISDTLSAVEFLQMTVRAQDVALVGICSGANVAIGAATLRPDIRRLVLWSALPFQPQRHAATRLRRARHFLKEYARKALRLETWQRLFRGEINLRGVGRAVVGERQPALGERNLKDSCRDILAAFAGYKGSALFITGTNDPEGMEGHKLFKDFCAKWGIDAHFHLVQGATHSYYARAHEREVLNTTVDWLCS